eukprot:UN16442
MTISTEPLFRLNILFEHPLVFHVWMLGYGCSSMDVQYGCSG